MVNSAKLRGIHLNITNEGWRRAWHIMCALAPAASPAPVDELGEGLRERCAQIVDELIVHEPPGRGKLMLAIAARAIRRGRTLTPAEKLENLNKALNEEGAE